MYRTVKKREASCLRNLRWESGTAKTFCYWALCS